MATSSLHSNPFSLLGVTTRDDRQAIVAQAEQRSLELNPEDCQKARNDLTNPRNRLAIEISWLPGVSPRRATQLLARLMSNASAIRSESGLPILAHCNLLAAVFEALPNSYPPQDLAELIQELAILAENIDAEDVARDIDEDRTISGFPTIKNLDQVEFEINERKRIFRNVINTALDRLPSAALLIAITSAVKGGTRAGSKHAPALIDEIVDSYAIEVKDLLEREAHSAKIIIESARKATSADEATVKACIDRLETVARNWDRVTKPIRTSAKARGIDHDASINLADSIRSLAIDLFNEHDMITLSQRLTKLLQETFTELPEISTQAKEDERALNEIQEKRMKAEAQSRSEEAERAKAIAFSAEVGIVFKDNLSISISGIDWKGKIYPLDSVTAVRWGAISHSVNGIPTGTDYEIAFATSTGSTSISLKKQSTYTGFIASLWRAVCVRLMIEMLDALQSGKSLTFGNMTIEDSGVILTKHKLLSSNEKIRFKWSEVHTWSVDGELIVGARSDKKTYASGSYKSHWNIHILDRVLSAGLKKGVSKLSDTFKD